MIDFRYHLVSIVSIFLALAVGIVLGAGPLKGELGDTLNKEVAGLRKDKADLNKQLQEANAGAEARDAYIAETNPIMLAGVLQDRRVALVVLPGLGCRGVRGDRRHPALVRGGRRVDDLGQRGLGDLRRGHRGLARRGRDGRRRRGRGRRLRQRVGGPARRAARQPAHRAGRRPVAGDRAGHRPEGASTPSPRPT